MVNSRMKMLKLSKYKYDECAAERGGFWGEM